MRRIGLICVSLWILPISIAWCGTDKDLQDLSGQVVPLVSSGQANSFVAGGELFSKGNLTSLSDIQYTVQVKNQTGDPVIGSSLILVVEQVMEIAKTRDVADRLEILGADGQTDQGKPFYYVPTGTSKDLAPYGVSEPIQVQIRNPDLLRLAPPTFGIFGIRRTETKRVEDLREVLIQKGILSPDEATEILGTPTTDSP
ncbi:hypothetical protein [Candidatus Nitronereus thalassa]|uniref:Lipoprotein n=1 Tax=Candidatus Nitronereus thalassa TaxID=3020898 RepID=A0ABU3KAL5_9BACT|nr:hypothetical protein [Candidatus Nitronereus thalassa]MDT7043242.1 hypothetical protein [Candidatus Nitronereus thalassa]